MWDRIEIFPLSGGEFLRLGPLRKNRHVGDYYCKASNEVGTATSQTVSLAVYRGGTVKVAALVYLFVFALFHFLFPVLNCSKGKLTVPILH